MTDKDHETQLLKEEIADLKKVIGLAYHCVNWLVNVNPRPKSCHSTERFFDYVLDKLGEVLPK